MKLIATEGPLKGQVLDLKEKDEWILGRDPTECSFLLEDTTVSRKHAKIYKTAEGYVIKNLSTTNPIEVNDERVDEYLLEENDKLKIGDTIFVYTALEEEDLKEEPKEEPKIEEVLEEKEEKPPKEEKPEEIEEEKEKIIEHADETIFEEEEETPLSLLIDAPFILKVISGSNAGSEFGMEKSKSFIIGKDVAVADIIFSDLSVSKQNTKITIDENSEIFVEDLGSKNGTYVNNKKIEEKTKITSQDLITVGTTTFLVIEKEAAQETIYSPAPTFEMEEEKKEEEAAIKKTVWKKQFIPTRHLLFAGTFIIIFFIIFLSFFGLFRAKDIEVVKKLPIEKIENIIKEYETIEFSFNEASANLFLAGHVLTSIDKQELMYDLNGLSFIQNIEDNIVVDELTVKNFNDSLNEEETFRSVFVLANKPGNYVLDGYVKTADNFNTLNSFVNSNFPYLNKLDNKVVIDQVLQIQIAALLTKKGFTTLSFEMISGKLVLAGRYNKKQESSYKALMQEFLKTPGIHSIKNLAIPSDAMTIRIDLTSKYKITGWAKYDGHNSVVANGKIIISGDLLDGMEVTNVSENAILLEKDDIKYKINYSP